MDFRKGTFNTLDESQIEATRMSAAAALASGVIAARGMHLHGNAISDQINEAMEIFEAVYRRLYGEDWRPDKTL